MGKRVGHLEKCFVGCLVGSFVGLLDGSLDGRFVGRFVAYLNVGWRVGLLFVVGALVGIVVLGHNNNAAERRSHETVTIVLLCIPRAHVTRRRKNNNVVVVGDGINQSSVSLFLGCTYAPIITNDIMSGIIFNVPTYK